LRASTTQPEGLLVAKLSGLSPKSISYYAGLVVASAMGDDVEELSSREWNHEFLDIPLVENRRCPSI